ncbi:MAG: peptidase, partial [Methylotenera sp.]|nr:peptidase [Methylotenera sp.]
MRIIVKKTQSNSARKNLLTTTLLASLLSVLSLQSVAFDLKGALKDAVQKEIGQKPEPTTPTETPSTNTPPVDAASANNTATSAETAQPAFNWKNPSKEEEIALGREIAGNLLGAAPLVKDAALQKYVNSVGRWVASQSERPDLPWRFGVIESDDLNAF